MRGLVIVLLSLMQGIQALPNQNGTISGILKNPDGKPAAGVRVTALAVSEGTGDPISSAAMGSITETDGQGHFRLENIPPGRYYITAGRVDYPTYFPGTQDARAGTIFAIKSRDSISGVDFEMSPLATRPPDLSDPLLSFVPSIEFTIKVSTENGTRVPLYTPLGFTAIRIKGTTDNREFVLPLTATSLEIQQLANATVSEFRLTIDNLPQDYAVKSIRLDNTDITTDKLLKVPAASSDAVFKVARTIEELMDGMQKGGKLVGGPIAFYYPPGSLSPATIYAMNAAGAGTPAAPPLAEMLEIVLTQVPSVSTSGVRVTGKASNAEPRSIFISGVPGTLFSDGSFEFVGVLPGRHRIATLDNPESSRPQVALVNVGNTDLAGIQLQVAAVLPIGIQTPTPPTSNGLHPAGSLPLSVLRGDVFDGVTGEAISNGAVYLTGRYGKSFQIDDKGHFEVSQLLPGKYAVEIQSFAHRAIQQTIDVEEVDLNKEFIAVPLE